MLLDEKMMWDGQGPVFLGKYDATAGRPDMGNLINVYQIGRGRDAKREKLTDAQRQARYQAKKKAHALCQLFAGKPTA